MISKTKTNNIDIMNSKLRSEQMKTASEMLEELKKKSKALSDKIYKDLENKYHSEIICKAQSIGTRKGFDKCFELISEREQKLQSENEKLKETIEELKKPLTEQMFYARKKLENSDKPNTFVAIDALLNELDAISENEKLKEREKFLNEKLQILIKQRNTYMFMLGECSEIDFIAHVNNCDREIEEVGK